MDRSSTGIVLIEDLASIPWHIMKGLGSSKGMLVKIKSERTRSTARKDKIGVVAKALRWPPAQKGLVVLSVQNRKIATRGANPSLRFGTVMRC